MVTGGNRLTSCLPGNRTLTALGRCQGGYEKVRIGHLAGAGSAANPARPGMFPSGCGGRVTRQAKVVRMAASEMVASGA